MNSRQKRIMWGAIALVVILSVRPPTYYKFELYRDARLVNPEKKSQMRFLGESGTEVSRYELVGIEVREVSTFEDINYGQLMVGYIVVGAIALGMYKRSGD